MARTFVAASSQYLTRSGVPVTAAPLSVAAWVKPTSLAASRGVVSLSAFAATNQFFEMYLDSATSKVLAQSGGATTSAAAASSATVTSGVWSHACAVFASASSRAAYLNGTNKGTDATACGAPSSALDTLGVGIYDTISTHFFPFDGDLAEVAIWNVALTDVDVAVLALGISPLLVRPEALVFYPPIMGLYSPEIDLMGRRDLTVTGPTAAVHPRIYAPASGLVLSSITPPSNGRMFLVF